MILLPIHVVGGLTAIAAGYVALSTLKGGTPHRRAGAVFVYAMLVMAASGATMALLTANMATALGGVLAAYFVLTGRQATRPRGPFVRQGDVAATVSSARSAWSR